MPKHLWLPRLKRRDVENLVQAKAMIDAAIALVGPGRWTGAESVLVTLQTCDRLVVELYNRAELQITQYVGNQPAATNDQASNPTDTAQDAPTGLLGASSETSES